MRLIPFFAAAAAIASITSGASKADVTDLVADSWVDPTGCEFLIFSSGTEGYLAENMTPGGGVVCGLPPSEPLSGLEIWLDPDGCAHWFANQGPRGLLANIRFPDGRPSCGNAARQLAAQYPAAELLTTLWKDPNQCWHWVADDGFEGFMSSRLRRDGTPVCEDGGPVSITLAADGLFNVNSAELTPLATSELTDFFQKMNAAGKSRISIVGHTDSDGSTEYNQDLSVRRAAAVAAFGEKFGVSADIAGRGESSPVAPNDTAANKARNRRVEIAILN